MSEVLVVRRGGLGDTLLMVPTLRALRRARPERRLHFAGVREFVEVLRSYGAVDHVLSSEGVALWSLGTDRGAATRERLARYAHLVSDDPSVTVLASADTAVQTFDPRSRSAAPIGLQIARQLGLEPVWPDDAWLLPARANAVVGPLLLAPGSGGRAKCWPRERWLELAERAGCAERVHVVVGPAESERDDPRQWPWPAPVHFVAEPEPIRLAAHLTLAAAYVGNDSGPSHLAAMLGVPTVVIFGPTAPGVWAPPGPHVHVVGGGRELAGIECAEVLEALRAHGSRARTLSQ